MNIDLKNKKTLLIIAAVVIVGILLIVLLAGGGLDLPSGDLPGGDTQGDLPVITGAPTSAPDAPGTSPATDAPSDTPTEAPTDAPTEAETQPAGFDLAAIPPFSDVPFAVVNDNVPFFTEADMVPKSFETYGDLDSLGRCTTCFACVGKDLMPTDERGDISKIYPTGWVQNYYPFVEQEALYNRSHLIGHQLTGENDNKKNLITGTRYMNADGMIPFENMVADYVLETNGHVLYRVTPIFEGNNLVAAGVLMEAKSVEDNGEAVEYCVFCYNVQPGVKIDYKTGKNEADGTGGYVDKPVTFVLNFNSGKYHTPGCSDIASISEKNVRYWYGTEEELLLAGYVPHTKCNK